MSTLTTPGVYIKEIDAFPLSVAQVATAIPAFIGYTGVPPTPEGATQPLVPTPDLFEPVKIVSMLEFEQYFGGAPTVTLTSNEKPYLYDSMNLFYANGGGECYIIPIGHYAVGLDMAATNFIDGLTALAGLDEPTLILFPDAVNLSAADLGTVQQAALNQAAALMDRFVIMDVKQEAATGTPAARVDADLLAFRNGVTNSLKYGAAYYPYLTLSSGKTVPSSAAIAGVYAQTDATRGVWKAPANVGITGIAGLSANITDAIQGGMNVTTTGKSVNAIRQFTGRGLIVWGARTLDGNSNDWRYINVRRLANTIEESVKKAAGNYVFEPNVAQTWLSVKGMIVNYLTNVWNDGGLAGAKPEDAFFVSVGLGQTMTALDINEGRMIVKVGYAPVKPAEFIIIEFKQILQQS